MRALRIAIHDYGAFPFTAQLARTLAERGHCVQLLVSDLDPRAGTIRRRANDHDRFEVKSVSVGTRFSRTNFLVRAFQECLYARTLASCIKEFKADVVFNTNCGMIASRAAQIACQKIGGAYVHWTQDIHTHTIGYVLERRFGLLGIVGKAIIRSLERTTISNAAHVIIISQDFEIELSRHGIKPSAVTIIPNWMPADEIQPLAKQNEWSNANDVAASFNIVFAGALGFKHDESFFVNIALAMQNLKDVRVIVLGRGIGFKRLEVMKDHLRVHNLILLDWVDHERYPLVLAGADVLVTAIVRDASASSVPSKILGYLCAGRPVLAALPAANDGCRIVAEAGAGFSVEPEDWRGAADVLRRLYGDPQLRALLGERARKYAEVEFAIEPIAERFESIARACRT